MFLKDKEVFLAGATGLAGTSIMTHILENCPKTRIRASCFRSEPFITHDRVTYVRGDLTSRDDCRRMVRGCNAAIMAAATTGGARASVSVPWEQVSDNVTMDVQLLHALHLEQVPRVMFVSTASVYQDFTGPIREEDLDLNCDPHPAYLGVGWSKRFVEKLCRFWYEKAGMAVVIARSANIYGPFAKFDPAVSHFVAALIRKAADRMDPFEVWGDPRVVRDIIYGEDFARAVVLMLDRDDLTFDVFNVGSGVQTSVGDVAAWALKNADHRPKEIRYRGDGPTTISYRALDCSRIKEKLGWEPRHSPKEGVRRTAQWWIQNRDWWKR